MGSPSSFAELGLRAELLRAVAEAGYTTPTPIQTQAIPLILAGKDVMGGAQTGTGKTAGFALPILHKLAPLANTSPSPARHAVRALILTPTRELAIQVEESIRVYGKYTGLKSTVVYGGVDIKQQLPIVRGGVDIRVAYSTISSRSPCTLARSRSLFSMRPIACSTWVSSPTSKESWRCFRPRCV